MQQSWMTGVNGRYHLVLICLVETLRKMDRIPPARRTQEWVLENLSEQIKAVILRDQLPPAVAIGAKGILEAL